jgi:hypothetical protein
MTDWQDQQKAVARGVTDGTVMRDLAEALRAATKDRNDVIEEVAQEIERFTFAFGVDTVDSFVAFVRGMKS